MVSRKGRNDSRRQLCEQLDQLFPPALFRACPQHGHREWTPRLTLRLSLIMFWLPGKVLDEQFSQARRLVKILKPHWKIPRSFAGFVAAQQYWRPLWGTLLPARLRPDDSIGAAWRVQGWLLLAVDGTRFECPRTRSNEDALHCAGRDKTGPQIYQTLLQHVGTGLPWDFRLGPGTDSERRHLKEMLPDLPPQTLLTADSGFVSYEWCEQLIDAGIPFVLRIGGNKTLIEPLDKEADEPIVWFWPEKFHDRQPLQLRRIDFRSTGGLPVVLLTNVLDRKRLSDEQAREIYRSRWGIEVSFRHLKQTMDFRSLKSRTPQTVFNEQHWRLVSYWTLQKLVVSEQLAAGQNPQRFSPARARREIREVLQLLQERKGGRSLRQRWLQAKTDSYQRKGPKATRKWPRKKKDKPPKPPRTRLARDTELQTARELGFKFLLIS